MCILNFYLKEYYNLFMVEDKLRNQEYSSKGEKAFAHLIIRHKNNLLKARSF